ncbi:MAG: hypothetical protein V3S58_02865 [Nitrosomonadaceae bacterium]
MKRYYLSILGILTLSGCALLAYNNFDKIFGPSLIRNRVVEKITADEVDYWQEVKPILITDALFVIAVTTPLAN